MSTRTKQHQLFADLDAIVRDFEPFFLGVSPFQKVESLSKCNTSFPPYNHYKVDENVECIEMAVAGFSKEDISVQVDEHNFLVVTGEKKEGTDRVYIHQGLANRKFTRSWSLQENSEIEVTLSDGILKIMIKLKPKEDKTRYLTIG